MEWKAMEHIGILEDLTDTAVQVGGKRFYLPAGIRARIIYDFKSGVEAKMKVHAMYDKRNNLTDLIPVEGSSTPAVESPSTVSAGSTEVYIYPATDQVEGNSERVTTKTPAKQPEPEVPVRKGEGSGKKVHIDNQSSGAAPQVTLDDPSSPTPKKTSTSEKKMKEASVFTEFTKNKTIAIEFCIARASDIVAKHWEKIPPDEGHQTLTDKVNDIEKVSDQLLAYLIKKIGES
jgi:hypothetical protein